MTVSACKEYALLRSGARCTGGGGIRGILRCRWRGLIGVLESTGSAESAARSRHFELTKVPSTTSAAATGRHLDPRRRRGRSSCGWCTIARSACSGSAACELCADLRLEGAVDAGGVGAGVHAVLAAAAAVLEALAAGAVAALGEPELASEGRQLAVLRGHRSSRHLRTTTPAAAVPTSTSSSAATAASASAVGAGGGVHALYSLKHFALKFDR